MSMEQEMEKMVARLRSLSEHAPKIVDSQVGQTPKTLVWTKNKAKLYRYTHTSDTPIKLKTPLLIIYALVNKGSRHFFPPKFPLRHRSAHRLG